MTNCCHSKIDYRIDRYKKNLFDLYAFVFDICLTSIGLLIIHRFLVEQKESDSWIDPKILFFALIYLIFGRVVWIKVAKEIRAFYFFSENFLMTIASIAAFQFGNYYEGLAILFFYRLGEIFVAYAENKSTRAIEKLVDLKPNFVRVKKGNSWEKLPINELQKGDVYQLVVGDRNSTDAVILKGNGTLDKSIISGESIPVFVEEGQKILAGTLLKQGSLELMALSPANESTFERILTLAKTSQKHKSHAERFIRVFSRYYTPIVITFAFFVAIMPIFNKEPWDWEESIMKAGTLLIIACPCALVISVPLSYFSAIGAASKLGLIFKGSQYISKYAKIKHFVFDKTGTLTLGVFSVKDILCFKGTQDELIYLGTQIAQSSTHPLSQTLLEYGKKKNIMLENCDSIKECAGLGISCNYKKKQLLLGQQRWLKQHGITIPDKTVVDKTSTYIGYNGYCLGIITFEDTLRPTSLSLIEALKKDNINVSILSGDSPEAVKSVAESLKITDFKSQLLPEEKLSLLSKLIAKSGNCVVYVGDGINDLPSISRADVGIAIGEGSDSALEIADIVLLGKNSYALYEGLKLSQRTQKIVWQNIIFAIGVKILVLGLGINGKFDILQAIFADTGVTVLTIFNAFRLFQKK